MTDSKDDNIVIFNNVLSQIESRDMNCDNNFQSLIKHFKDDETFAYLKESVVALAEGSYENKNVMLIISIVIIKIALEPFNDKIFKSLKEYSYMDPSLSIYKLFFYISKIWIDEVYTINVNRIMQSIEDVSEEYCLDEIVHPKYLFILSGISPYDTIGENEQIIYIY